ncbi:MAG: carboxypeptidase regulatory-like domain-containing protein [Planctomycetes bacterium]|nr:carboxypeptidase regulatory-like domain-containing protein [Planctomycetota bacterium]
MTRDRRILPFVAVVIVASAAFWAASTRITSPPELPPTDFGVPPTVAANGTGASPHTIAVDRVAADAADITTTSAPVADGALTGRLLQAGRPLGDIELLCCSGTGWQPHELSRTRTQADGAFRLPAPDAPFWLTADAESLPVHWRTEVRAPDRPALGDVDVPVPGVIVGRVHDGGGGAVAGATVACELSSYQMVSRGGTSEWPRAVTDAQGRFRLLRLPPGERSLRCEADAFAVRLGHAVEVTAGAEVTTEIALDRGALLRGVVLDWRGHPLDGAQVRCDDGRDTATDALGRFTFAHFRRGANLTVRADGHMEQELQFVMEVEPMLQVRLERAVTLRGIVHGSEGRPGTVYISTATSPRADASNTLPYGRIFEELDIVREGRFEVDGLSCAAFELTVTVPGVGKVGPVFVDLQGDTEVEMTLVREHRITVRVQDADGAPLAAAELVRDPAATKFPTLYAPGPQLIGRILSRRDRKDTLTVRDGEVTFGNPAQEALAFVVSADGYLPAAMSFPAGALPSHTVVQMTRAGSLRGAVGGGDRVACGAAFVFWPADQATPQDTAVPAIAQLEAEDPLGPRRAMVAADGSFAAANVAPGPYRGVLSRINSRTAAEPTGCAIVDAGGDPRSAVEFTVIAGQCTQIVVGEPALGVLRGRVLVNGQPTAGIVIAAARPAAAADTRHSLHGWFDKGDWDNEITYRFAPGQLTDDDGSFRLLYRDAGPIELRLRHPDGHATSTPIVVELPPPGPEVVRDLQLPIGGIRGRFPIGSVPEADRQHYRITLFPLRKATDDPFYSAGDFSSPIAWDCAHHEGMQDGAFEFGYLSAGTWLVRAHTATFGGALLWQRAVDVERDVVELGDIEVRAPVAATVRFAWADGKAPEGGVRGIWLWRAHGGDERAIWVATVAAADGAAQCAAIEPGDYTMQPFGGGDDYGWGNLLGGISGPPVAAPVQIRIATDGAVAPAVVTFVPLPAENGK